MLRVPSFGLWTFVDLSNPCILSWIRIGFGFGTSVESNSQQRGPITNVSTFSQTYAAIKPLRLAATPCSNRSNPSKQCLHGVLRMHLDSDHARCPPRAVSIPSRLRSRGRVSSPPNLLCASWGLRAHQSATRKPLHTRMLVLQCARDGENNTLRQTTGVVARGYTETILGRFLLQLRSLSLFDLTEVCRLHKRANKAIYNNCLT